MLEKKTVKGKLRKTKNNRDKKYLAEILKTEQRKTKGAKKKKTRLLCDLACYWLRSGEKFSAGNSKWSW